MINGKVETILKSDHVSRPLAVRRVLTVISDLVKHVTLERSVYNGVVEAWKSARHNAHVSLAQGNAFIIVTERPATCNCAPYCSLSYGPRENIVSSA